MDWLKQLFKVQTRESEIEATVHNCVNHIINSVHQFGPNERMRIAHRVNETVISGLQEEHMELMEKVKEYEQVLDL